MRTVHLLALALLAAATFAACSDSPTTTTTQLGGPITIEKFQENAAYVWYQTGYDAYPEAGQEAAFNTAVNTIKAALSNEANNYEVLMVLKPNCSCQHTQTQMPRVMKTLDQAGFPHEDIELYLTDTRLAGIDDIKTMYGIDDSDQVPTFIVLRNGQELGRIEQGPASGSTIENELAQIFSLP